MARAARDKKTGLTKREEAFCQYLVNNVESSDSDAYRHAYNCARMKPETVNNKAYNLKKKAHIRARIEQLRKERAERTQIDSDYVLTSLYEARELDVMDILDDTGNVRPIRGWPRAWRINITGLDLHELVTGDTETIIRKLKLPDKTRLLELIGKHVGVQAFNEKRSTDVNVKMPLSELAKQAASE